MQRTDAILLDTHTLLWWQAGGDRLSTAAASAIRGADEILVSPVSCWEVSMLEAKGRIELDRTCTRWINDLLEDPRIEVAEFTPQIAVAAGQLDDFHGDPIDRWLFATARALGLSLVSKDREFRRHDGVTVIW